MASPRHVDREKFLANLRRSGLVSPEQLAAVADRLPDTPRGRVVARTLVDLGLITRFQAERLLVGRTGGFLLGQYRILDQLGRGGMGRVYKAEHRTMGRIVALKVLAPDLLRTDRAQELFLREVRAAARLVHPNIVTAYDANQVDGRYFLVLEYVDGPNLEQLVRKQGPLPVGQACDYARQITQGLQCAHALGMVHRDVKPANVLVQQRGLDGSEGAGIVKISDFGLARLCQPGDAASPNLTILTRENAVLGTPDYLSPEQARDLHNTDIRSDLYSLGCTFYYLLAGQVPFPGGTTMEKLIRHGTEEPTPVTDLRPEVPPAVADIVARLMAKDPAERYQTPAELIAILEPFAVGGTMPWTPPKPPSGPLFGGLSTPAGTGSGEDFDLPAADGEGLAATVMRDPSPTPLVSPGASPVDLLTAYGKEQSRMWRMALLVAGSIAGGILLAMAALALLGR
jgi:serine/threonine protein kinase